MTPILVGRDWGLREHERRFVQALLNAEGAPVSRQSLLAAMQSNADPKGPLLSVVAHRVRGPLARHGLDLQTIYGRGYALAAAERSVA